MKVFSIGYKWLIIALLALNMGSAFGAAPPSPKPPTQTANTHTILVLGDSLSAAYGIPREQGWVSLLQQRLENGNVVNASISGETTDGGLARIPALLQKHNPTIAIIELGANDGLRGFQIQRTRDNLAQIISLCQKANAKVLLIGMKIPPNYGLKYTSDFYETYTLTAKQFNIPLVPFLLDGVATDPGLMQDDGLHPRATAQPKLLNTVWHYLKPLL
ncbi:MAG: arylesterase [Spongiibacteraceae bacterium]